jgi:HSP20 family molecular chaperone IbpA
MSDKKFFEDYFKNGKNSLPFNWDFQKVSNALRDSVRTDYQIRRDINGTGVTEIDCEVPGFTKEDITVDIEGEYLHVHASGGTYIAGKSFNFYVGDISADEISARCANGVLTITIKPITRSTSKNSVVVE